MNPENENMADLPDIDSQEFNEMFPGIIGTQFQFSDATGIQNTTCDPFDFKKPNHLERFPDIDPIESDYKFDVIVLPDNNSNWVFNQQKLFIKMNSTMTISASYIPQVPNQQMFVRAMTIYTSRSEMHLPVKRCANHRMATPSMQPESYAKANNILKIDHPKASYMGLDEGQTFEQRLSIVVPIDSSMIDENQRVAESIRLEFGCQNSCVSGINRRATAIVFTLEDVNGKLLGKCAIQFKVCSCPKRDSEREMPTKRKNGGNEAFPKGKIPKFESPSQLFAAQVKNEPNEQSESSNGTIENSNIFSSTSVTLNMPTKLVPQLLKQAFQIVAGEMAANGNVPQNRYLDILRDIEKLQKDFIRSN